MSKPKNVVVKIAKSAIKIYAIGLHQGSLLIESPGLHSTRLTMDVIFIVFVVQ